MKKCKRKNSKHNRCRTVTQLLALLLIVIFPITSIGQYNKYEKSDSLFKYYRLPTIEGRVYQRLEKDDAILNVGCYFTTDTMGRVTGQKFIPFTEIGNKYDSYDSIWHSVITSLTVASKDWIFKPILWEFKNDKKAEAKINKVPFQRPFTGRPRYFIIVEISGLQGVGVIDKISFINDFKIGE